MFIYLSCRLRLNRMEVIMALGKITDVWSWQDGTLCSADGRFDAAQFEAAMRHQLRQYAGRRISDFLYHGRGGEAEHAQVNRAKECKV